MNDIISNFFLCAHALVYLYVIQLMYKNYLRPHLLKDQQNDRALMVQLKQKLSHSQTLMKVFKDQADYIAAIFQKIFRQQQQAQKLTQKLELERMHEHARIQAEYAEQQKKIAYSRAVQQAYEELGPEVIQQLRSELVQYAQDQGKGYLDDAIQELKEQSQLKSKK